MQGAYGGLVVIIMYAGGGEVVQQEDFLITQNDIPILTQASEQIDVQT